jgi:crossover junction endodeoxyribonuclease RuvC
MSCILGVDPGVKPTLAFWWSTSNQLVIVDGEATSGKAKGGRTRPIPELIRAALEEYEPELVVIEDVGSGQGKDGKLAIAGMSHCVGLVHGLAVGLGLPVRLVLPTTWKRTWGLIGRDKDYSRTVACEAWPTQTELFKRVKDHNRAEAGLLARHGLRLLPGIVSDLGRAA